MNKDLSSCVFMTLLGEGMKDVLLNDQTIKEFTNSFKEGKKVQGWKYLKKHQLYCVNVFQCAMNVLECVEDIEHINVFIKQYPYKKTLQNAGVTRKRYMQYHLENYLMRLVGLIDRLSLLVNEVYELGLPPELCRIRILERMEQMKGQSVIDSIKSFDKALKNTRTARNTISHQKKYNDKDLDEIGTYEFILLHSKADGENIIPRPYIDLMYKFFRTKTSDEMKDSLKAIHQYVLLVFKSLEETYQINHSKH